MKVESKKIENGDLQIVLTFDKYDQICLEHELLDIVNWYAKGPSEQKIASCKKRMIKEFKDQLMKTPEMQTKTMAEVNLIMDNEIELIKTISELPEYKNRKQREDEINLLENASKDIL